MNICFTGIVVSKGEILGEQLFSKVYQPDWRLVPKAEEAKFLNYDFKLYHREKTPPTARYPPLLEILAKEQFALENKEVPSGPLLLNLDEVKASIQMHNDDPGLLKRLREPLD